MPLLLCFYTIYFLTHLFAFVICFGQIYTVLVLYLTRSGDPRKIMFYIGKAYELRVPKILLRFYWIGENCKVGNYIIRRSGGF